MNLRELKNEFEILFEDLATSGSKGLNDYEKSICYTYAQESLIKTLAERGNMKDIQELIKFNVDASGTSSHYRTGRKYSKVPNLLVYLDSILKSTSKDIPAIEVPQTVISNMLASAYQYPPANLAYVVVGEDTDIVFPPLYFTTASFVTRYIIAPSPVILSALTGTDTIKGLTAATAPILKDSYQDELVNAAVQFAISIYIGQPEKEASNDGPRNKQ